MTAARTGPLVAIALLALLAMLGQRWRAYEVSPVVECDYRLAKLGRPAADVLFMGSSRAGYAVDAGYIERGLAAKQGRHETVERMALTANRFTQYRVLAREYLRNRGAPKLVIIQLSFNRDQNSIDMIDKPILNYRTIAYGRWSDLVDIQWHTRINQGAALLPMEFHREYRSLPRVALDKIAANIYSALRKSRLVIFDRHPDCDGDNLYKQHAYWPHNEVETGIVGWPATPLPDPQELESTVGVFLPLRLDNGDRKYEIDQHIALIETFRKHGSDVAVMTLPHYRENLSPEEVRTIRSIFGCAHLIETTRPFHEKIDRPESGYFIGAEHLNVAGAKVISTILIDEIAKVSGSQISNAEPGACQPKIEAVAAKPGRDLH